MVVKYVLAVLYAMENTIKNRNYLILLLGENLLSAMDWSVQFRAKKEIGRLQLGKFNTLNAQCELIFLENICFLILSGIWNQINRSIRSVKSFTFFLSNDTDSHF